MKNKNLLINGLWAFLFLTGSALFAGTPVATNSPVHDDLLEPLTPTPATNSPVRNDLLEPLPPATNSPVRQDLPEQLTQTQKNSKFPAECFIPHSPAERKLQVGDVVEVGIFGQIDTVAKAIPIAPDGKLYYMFLPGIQAEGRRADEVAAEMENELSHLFNNPQVSIIPKKFISNRFAILGKVNEGSLYPLETSITVRQAIARAKGIEQGRYHDNTIEIHNYNKSWLLRGTEKIPVNFSTLMKENDFSEDIYVRPGDVIYIASALGREVYLMGEVNSQQSQPYTAGMTLVQLITGIDEGSGGYLEDSADIKRVVLLRNALEDPKVFKINLQDILSGREHDVFLEAGDVVFVPEKSFLFTRNVVKSMVRTFVNTFASEFASDINREHLFPGGFLETRTQIP
ncbi:MAG: polysaccharide biosynthesis/export family protein [Kiritimatiellales bacterium]|nr:polysaccharide biosynthesis/export family protein [Kiritimatiellota bacterium]MBL7012276.1 polysaccharide biosynthesis/export family protein [Kiritimatiellales bacterium]